MNGRRVGGSEHLDHQSARRRPVVDDGQVLPLSPDVVAGRRAPPGAVPEVVRTRGAVPEAVNRADQHHHVAAEGTEILLEVFRAGWYILLQKGRHYLS